MSYSNALFNTYNYCLENGLVDNYANDELVLLPIYHDSRRSNKNDIIKIKLTQEGNLFGVEFMPEGAIITFPTTVKSMSRTSGVAAHPLCDTLKYLFSVNEGSHFDDYLRELSLWIAYNTEVTPESTYLNIIYTYIKNGSIVEDIVNNLYPSRTGSSDIASDLRINYIDDKGKEKADDLSKVFITFEIVQFFGYKNVSVSSYKKLHENYISYVNSKYEEAEKQFCVVSGEKEKCSLTHRGLLRNAKIISVSKNKMTYFGRFTSGENVVSIGYESSQKIHLMIKYLIENRKTCRKLSDTQYTQYMVNWFYTNTMDAYNFDPMGGYEFDYDLSIVGNDLSMAMNKYLSGFNGSLSKNEEYHIMMLDKLSDGRITIKYYASILVDDLVERVDYWHKSISYRYMNNEKKLVRRSPSLDYIVKSMFGVEREGLKSDKRQLVIDNDSMKKIEMHRLLLCLLEKRKIPIDYVNRIFTNFTQRHRYSKCWNQIVFVANCILRKYYLDYLKEEVSEMLDTENKNRSYLFGRLLAIYEKIEAVTYTKDEERQTNAEKLWNEYSNKPAMTMMRLKNKIMPYRQKLKAKSYGFYVYLENLEMNIISNLDDLKLDDREINKKLEYEFLFGYSSQKNDFYTSKKNNEKQEETCE